MSTNVYREQLVEPGDRVISAFDNMTWQAANSQAQEIGPHIGLAKTNSLHQRLGTDHAVTTLAEHGLYTFIDGKYHDIPETVEGHVREVTQSGASLITVHAAGNVPMLEAAVRGREKGKELITDVYKRSSLDRIGGLLGITVLTSLDFDDCVSIFGIDENDHDGKRKKVVQFANMALDAGLDGIVCSSIEVDAIRSNSNFDSLLTVVPGITPTFAEKAGDQKATGTPAGAINRGADLLVIGRGINKAADYGLTKAEAAQAIADEIGDALSGRGQ